ncbi:MAG: type II secretion system protein [Magnetococcales bacterium]|nr:type II secretion system protein [Magnetococcales bacterium]
MLLQLKKRQGGFSLIEIAIVLVIIGLLIGGVLKGQAMVKNSKIKRIATDVQAVQSAINAYSDSYWMLPGDDSGANGRWPTAVHQGDGNGLIEGLFQPTAANRTPSTAVSAATQETAFAWNHLYCEGLVKGECLVDTAATALVQPTNPAGGVTGIADGRNNIATSPSYLGISRKMICMKEIPTDYAMIYDTQFDDGAGDTGDIRGSAAADTEAAAGTATPYAPATISKVFICTGF